MMTRTPDEIKKGLECCTLSYSKCVLKCPYVGDDCVERLVTDALALIQQLEKRVIYLEALNQSNLSVITMQERTRDRLQEQISQLEAERDALMTFMQKECYYCKHNFSAHPDCPCLDCVGESHFEWRGVQKEDGK